MPGGSAVAGGWRRELRGWLIASLLIKGLMLLALWYLFFRAGSP